MFNIDFRSVFGEQFVQNSTEQLGFCRTPVLGLGLGVDFVFPPSQVSNN